MKYRIEMTEQADSDLRGIFEYIAFTLLEPEIAARQLERIENAILGLDGLPRRFKVFEKEPWHSRGLCQLIIFLFSILLKTKIKWSLLSELCMEEEILTNS